MDTDFIKAVENTDLIRVRLFIANELMLDPRGKSFSEMKNYAESNMPDLYEIHNDETYSLQQSEWNEAFLYSIRNDLENNFSRERVAIYEKVAKIVLKEKAILLDKEESKKYATSIHPYPTTKDHSSSSKKVYTGVTLGGAAVAITGLCLEKAALVGLGAVGLIIGGYLLYNESKK